MKIFRDNICLVKFRDLIEFSIPDDLNFDKESYNENDYVIFKDEKDIEYVKNREDIIDYDYVSSLSSDELDRKILNIEKDLEPLYIELSNTPDSTKRVLLEDNDFRNNLFKLDKVYYDLIHYKNNREEEDEKISKLLINNSLLKSLNK